jgi:hypothetical protein
MAVTLTPVVEAIYAHLTGDSNFNTAIGGTASSSGRLFYGTAPKGAAFPFCVYQVTQSRDELQAMSEASYAVSVQFSIFETKEAGPRACMDINDKLRTRLNRQTFSITGHTMLAAALEVERGPQDVDEAFFQQVSYLIRGFGS